MKRILIITITLAFINVVSASLLFSQEKITSANRAYQNCLYKNAHKLYLDVFKDDNSSDDDKVFACTRLAYLSWKIEQDIDQARNYANSALNYNINEVDILLELSEYELQVENFNNSAELCEKAKKIAYTDFDKTEVNVQEARIILKEAIQNIENNEDLDIKKIEDALNTIADINKVKSGRLDVNEIQLGLALILENGKSAFEAWKGYFRIPKNEKAKGILKKPESSLNDVLVNSQLNQLTIEQRNKLIQGLADSRFYHYAYLVDKLHSADNTDEVKDILNYYDFCKLVDHLSNNYHRNIALNNGVTKESREQFYNDLILLEKNLWNKLSWNEKALKFSDSNFKNELYKRFGTVFKDVKPYFTSLGKTGLFLFAHTIGDDKITVDQYGYSREIHFVNLDFMYANSYDGWFLGSKTGRLGGWNDKSLIVQMRRAYSDKPILYWNKISNEVLKKEWEESIIKLSQEDDKIALDNPVAYLPGLVNRMRYNACLRLIDSLEEKGLTGIDLRIAFISEFEKLNIQSSIISHEGRHAIDSKYRFIFEPTSKDFEYRAKLSEILYSEDPFFTFAFSSVYARNLNSKSKHSRGSRKVVVNLVSWMEENKKDIVGFDNNKPTLSQLNLLSEDQFLTVFKKMDPLYKKRGDK